MVSRHDSATTKSEPIRLLVLEGDGIGPEIVQATVDVVQAVDAALGISFAYETAEIGFTSLKQNGATITEAVVDMARAADGVILGPISHNEYPPLAQGGINPSGKLRKDLDLFANVRPAKSHPAFPPRCGVPVDLVIVRENTEGFYSDRNMHLGLGEFMPTPDVALSVRKVTREASVRIAEYAFRLAMKRRRKVTCVHKQNVLRMSDGFFIQCVREVAARYPDVDYDEKLVDAMAALLVRDASVYDVVVTTNMFGDILSDQASEISGSIGLAASINASLTHAIAQAQHGSAPDIAGQDRANPSSLIGSVAMLFDWLGEKRQDARLTRAGVLIEQALADTISNSQWRTADLGGPLGTRGFGTRVAENVRALAVEAGRGAA